MARYRWNRLSSSFISSAVRFFIDVAVGLSAGSGGAGSIELNGLLLRASVLAWL